jgi:hypothetical protein
MPCPEVLGRRPNNTPAIARWSVVKGRAAVLKGDDCSILSTRLAPDISQTEMATLRCYGLFASSLLTLTSNTATRTAQQSRAADEAADQRPQPYRNAILYKFFSVGSTRSTNPDMTHYNGKVLMYHKKRYTVFD